MDELMDELTPDDRGVFLVETQGSSHMWTITDDDVWYMRQSHRPSPVGLDNYNGLELRPLQVKTWPRVGHGFLTIFSPAADMPWHASSRIKSITRVEESDGDLPDT